MTELSKASITYEDVATHYDRTRLPAVNIKVYNSSLPRGEFFDDIVSEFELDHRLTAISSTELRDLVERYLETHDDIFWNVCESGFEDIVAEGKEIFGSHVEIYRQGRSGGWAVVEGLPEDLPEWDEILLAKWERFIEVCGTHVDDVPYQLVWSVLAHNQDELAGRVKLVMLRMVLTDEDLEAGEVTDWDWRTVLDLSDTSTLQVTDLGAKSGVTGPSIA
jgi:hypothetical protein